MTGEINSLYFKSRPGQYWSEDDQRLLLRGIKQYGVGRNEQIKANLLPQKTIHEIHLRTCLLVGAHDISGVFGVKSQAKLETIYQQNKQKGIEEGKWQFGLYMNKVRPT